MAFYIVNLLCITLTIAMHEFGHFYFAKRYGLCPPKFAVGFGREIVGHSYNGTRFSLNVIPFGGYVEMNEKSLNTLTRWQRIRVMFGGPLANMILCVIVALLYVLFGTIPESLADASTVRLALVAIVGSILLFFMAVPLTVYALGDILLNPIESLEKVDGPIGIVTGKAVPVEMLTGTTLFDQAMIITWIVSLSIGTFNLVPLSFLDGGRIFSELFAKFPTFIKRWNVATSGVLVVLILYMIGGDIYKLF